MLMIEHSLLYTWCHVDDRTLPTVHVMSCAGSRNGLFWKRIQSVSELTNTSTFEHKLLLQKCSMDMAYYSRVGLIWGWVVWHAKKFLWWIRRGAIRRGNGRSAEAWQTTWELCLGSRRSYDTRALTEEHGSGFSWKSLRWGIKGPLQ